MDKQENQCNTSENKFMSKYVGTCFQVKEQYENQCNTPGNKFMSKFDGACYNDNNMIKMK